MKNAPGPKNKKRDESTYGKKEWEEVIR